MGKSGTTASTAARVTGRGYGADEGDVVIGLLEDVALFMTRNRSTAHLAEEAGAPSHEAVRVGVVLSLPVVIANLAGHVEDPVGSYWLQARLVELGPSKAVDYAELTEEHDVPRIGAELLALVIGDRLEAIVEPLALRAGLDEGCAGHVLTATAAGVLVRLADRHSGDDRREEISAGLQDELVRLHGEGWSDWMATVAPAAATAVADRVPLAPPLTSRPSNSRLVAPGPPAERPPIERTGVDRRDEPATTWRTLALAGLALVVVVVTAIWLVTALSGGDDRTEATGSDETSGAAGPSTTAEATAGVDARPATGDLAPGTEDGGSTDGSGEAAAAPSGDVVVIEVPLDDPLGQLGGTGSALLTFDRVTGGICYEFDVEGVASPYDGHIHVGPAGVKGGIVVDFGELNEASRGCLDNNPVDTEAILADIAGHYVEFHDANGIDTVRSQLAEAERVEGDVPIADPEAGAGGAVILISDGALTLSGEVPDQVTIDKLLESFADIDLGSTRLVDELEIVPGAPRPSGNIVVDETILFGLDSDRLSAGSGAVLDDLATIVRARPAWSITVVGHTDSSGDDVYNLELSLRRAEAVRSALIEAGVAEGALTVRGAGSTEPIADNGTPEGRARNRRIELEVEAG